MQVTAVSLARNVVLAAAMSGVMLSASPVVAANDAAHTLADKFSRAAQDGERAAQDAERAEAAKRAEAKRARATERALQQRREAEARRKA